MNLFADIERAIAETTDAELERYDLGGPPRKSEKPIGVIHDLEVRKLFVACKRTKLLSEMKSIEARLKGEDELFAQSQRLGMIADAMKELGWVAACDSLDSWDRGEHYGIALRDGWMLVHETQPQSPLERLLALGGQPE